MIENQAPTRRPHHLILLSTLLEGTVLYASYMYFGTHKRNLHPFCQVFFSNATLQLFRLRSSVWSHLISAFLLALSASQVALPLILKVLQFRLLGLFYYRG